MGGAASAGVAGSEFAHYEEAGVGTVTDWLNGHGKSDRITMPIALFVLFLDSTAFSPSLLVL